MAISRTLTHLPLDRYAAIMRIPLTHFNQFGGQFAPQRGGCDSIWDQDDRDTLAWTISQAERYIIEYLRYFPIPTYVDNEQHQLGDGNVRWDWRNAHFQTNRKKVIGYGRRQQTLIFESAPVTYVDADSDPAGIAETARIGSFLYDAFPTCDECSIHVYFREADGAKDWGHAAYEIKTILQDEDANSFVLEAPAALFMQPDNWKLTENASFGSDDPEAWIYSFEEANLVSYVDVYCETLDTSEQGIMYWSTDCVDCDVSGQQQCAYSVNDKNGTFRMAPADSCAAAYAHKPEFLRVSYLSGHPLDDDCRMDALIERAIVKLTNALLPEPPCNYCDLALQMWTEDRKDIDPLTPEAASMPWDIYHRGALDAWRIVKRLAY